LRLPQDQDSAERFSAIQL